MAQKTEILSYFHLSGANLAVGSIIEPGNWGRVLLFMAGGGRGGRFQPAFRHAGEGGDHGAVQALISASLQVKGTRGGRSHPAML
jgi:hypothetical protein